MDVVAEMLTMRGYQQGETNLLFDVWCAPNRDNIFVSREIYVKLTVGIFKDVLAKLNNCNSKHCLLIYEIDITPHVKEIIRTTNVDPVIEIFCKDELIFNITNHHLQPKFELIDRCDYDPSHLPKFKQNDPIVKFFNWPKGSIIKISPKDARLQISYRVVI